MNIKAIVTIAAILAVLGAGIAVARPTTTDVNGADAFYGYYTLEVNKDGKIYGMLSVNGNTGAVWYHNWHGTFVKILEVE